MAIKNILLDGMLVIEATIEGLEEAQAALEKYAMQVERGVGMTIQQITVIMWRTGKGLTPVDTGRLVNSISYLVEGGPPHWTSYVFSQLYYSKYVEQGTGRYRGAQMLGRTVERTAAQRGAIFNANVQIKQA